jgi:hypothetical protein
VPQPPTPPGVPKLPTCQKEGSASSIRVKVDGTITVDYALHSIYWGECNAAHGGGSHTDASGDLDFGTPTADPATAHYRTDAKTKKKTLLSLDATPQVQATVTPKQDQRHEVAPGCGVVKDPTSCHEAKGTGEATVHLSDNADLARLKVQPPALVPTLCTAPFAGNSAFDNLEFEHPLEDLDEAKMALAASPTAKPHSATIELAFPAKPCSAYGIAKPALVGGTIEKCTIKADFRVVLTRLSQPKR